MGNIYCLTLEKNRVRFFVKDVFVFAEYQRKDLYGIRSKLTSKREDDNHGIKRTAAADGSRVPTQRFGLYAPHYTLSNCAKVIIRTYCFQSTN